MKHFSTGEWENEQSIYNNFCFKFGVKLTRGTLYYLAYPMQDRNFDISFFDHLEEFFERSYRYGTLRITNSKGVVQGQTSNTKKLLLLKEFPPMIFKNLDRWHNLLQ